MSQQPFPEIVDVKKFFSRQSPLSFVLSQSRLKRLAQYLNEVEASNGSEIDVELNLIQDEEGRFILSGTMQGRMSLTCQRCLQEVEYDLASDFIVRVVDELKAGGDRELAQDELDVVVSVDGKLDLLALIEDELILSLPLVIYHKEQDCNQTLVEMQSSAQQKTAAKPFAELAALKKQLKLAADENDESKDSKGSKGGNSGN